MNETFVTITRYAYMIIIISSVIIYGFNKDDYKQDSTICASEFQSRLYSLNNPTLYFWKEDGLCCHHALNEENNIVEEC